MFDGVVEAAEKVGAIVADLDVDALDPADAAELVGLFVRVEQLAAAGRVLATRAVAGGEQWKREGFRSPAAWMAAQAGTFVGTAVATIEMAKLLDDLPATAAAFRAGRLSEAQMREVVDAASEWPAAEQQLLEAAGRLTFKQLKEECQRVKAAALTDADERHRRVRQGRYLRSWMDRDGAARASIRGTPDEVARFLAAVDSRCDEIIVEAFRGGWYERAEAHRLDALIDLCCTTAPVTGTDDEPRDDGPRALVNVFVDYEALVRGDTAPGERCEIPGLGPIPVSVARHMAEDCILKILLTKGVDITAVAHAGRYINEHLRSALEAQHTKCLVPACDIRRGLQWDHRKPHSEDGPTSMANLGRLCGGHHRQKTHEKYTYRRGLEGWIWIAPETPTEPPLHPP